MSSDRAETPADIAEFIQGESDLVRRVRDAYLDADPGLPHGHDRVAEADDIDALLEQGVGEVLAEAGVVRSQEAGQPSSRGGPPASISVDWEKR